jgi:hypothetical protein
MKGEVSMQEGLYESVLTTELQRHISNLRDLEVLLDKVDPADQTQVLTRHVAAAIERRLGIESDPQRRLLLANALLTSVEGADGSVVEPLHQLQAVRPAPSPGVVPRYRQRPKTPLNDAALLTNAHGEPSLAAELKAEIDSADRIDLLCAFVMWRGLRLLEEPLATAHEAGVPIRVATTTYIGGTEREALDRLVPDDDPPNYSFDLGEPDTERDVTSSSGPAASHADRIGSGNRETISVTSTAVSSSTRTGSAARDA